MRNDSTANNVLKNMTTLPEDSDAWKAPPGAPIMMTLDHMACLQLQHCPNDFSLCCRYAHVLHTATLIRRSERRMQKSGYVGS
jgi:hypothetical protein